MRNYSAAARSAFRIDVTAWQVHEWVDSIDPDPATHVLLHAPRAIARLDLGVEVDDAIEIAEKIDI